MPSKLRRTESVVVSEEETATSDSEMSEEDDTQQLWEQAEDRVADMVEALKSKLDKIAPGIGDRITLAKFCVFVEMNSTCLE